MAKTGSATHAWQTCVKVPDKRFFLGGKRGQVSYEAISHAGTNRVSIWQHRGNIWLGPYRAIKEIC